MAIIIENFSLKSLTEEEFAAAYTKLEDLGDGGSASAASYVEVATGREVAIKRMGESKTYARLQKSVEIMVSEYECLRKLASENPLRMLQVTSHQLDIPGIPRVYDLFVIETPESYIFHIVMDVVKTEPGEWALSVEQLEEAGKITPEFLDRFVPWLLRTVAAVHERGVVHRDIVGMNILVDTDGQFFLIDFGEGYDLGPDALVPPPTEVSGTAITYARDPETRLGQYSVANLKKRDVYDVGILLFLLCKGEHWNTPASFAETSAQLAATTTAGPSKYDPILYECLYWTPQLRPNSKRLRQLAQYIELST